MTCKDCVYFKRCVVLGVELDMHRLRFASTCKDGRLTGQFLHPFRCLNITSVIRIL